MNYILDSNGKPVIEPDLMKWSEWFSTADRILTKTFIKEQEVSTVFLGLSSLCYGPPRLYETMVFPECDISEQYCTKEEALAGHERIVNELNSTSTE